MMMTIPISYPLLDTTTATICPFMCPGYSPYATAPPATFASSNNCGCPLDAYCPTFSIAAPFAYAPQHHSVHQPATVSLSATLPIGGTFYPQSTKLLLTGAGVPNNGSHVANNGTVFNGPFTATLPGSPVSNGYFPVAPSSPTLSGGSSASGSICSSNGSLKQFLFTPGQWKQS